MSITGFPTCSDAQKIAVVPTFPSREWKEEAESVLGIPGNRSQIKH